ncbi:MAG: hypothetical protein ACRCVT_10535 [Leadbetterella sp.]
MQCATTAWGVVNLVSVDNIPIMARKRTQESVRLQFAKYGWTKTGEYISCKSSISCICPKGHNTKKRIDQVNKGIGCQLCLHESLKLTQAEVEERFKKEGFLLISNYKNAQEKMDVICPKGHNIKINLANWSGGRRCGACRSSNFPTDESVKAIMNAEGFEKLSIFTRSKDPIMFCCPKGHTHHIKWGDWLFGNRCGICLTEKSSFKYYNNRGGNRVRSSIMTFLKKNKIQEKWQHFYSTSDLNSVSVKINSFYKNCPRGSHVDHIVPISFFDLTIKNELEACWNINNLRYLDGITNLRRNNNMTTLEINQMWINFPEIISKASNLDFYLSLRK